MPPPSMPCNLLRNAEVTRTSRRWVSVLLFLLVCTGCACLPHRTVEKSSKPNASGSLRGAPVVYVAIGDSTGLGLGARNGGGYVDLLLARIQQTHPGSRLINLSTGWATTADVLSQHMKRFPVEQVTLVTVSIGLNDLLQGVSDEQFAGNYEEIISLLEKTGAQLIVTNLPDISSAPMLARFEREDLTRAVALFNKRIEEIAERHNVPVVNLYQLSSAVVPSYPDFFSTDGLHPSDAGYQFWAEAMWPTVEKTLNE